MIGSLARTAVAAACILGFAGPTLAAEPASLDVVRAFESVLVSVSERVQPSVVLLEVHSSSTRGVQSIPGVDNFFPVEGLGSGFIIDDRGTILTNHHVIEGADRIDVTLHDGRQLRAVPVASSPESDVGLVRIIDPPADLPVAELGSSRDLRIGQFAIAVGAPLGYARSVTYGHISGLHRTDVGQHQMGPFAAPGFEVLSIQDFIQVDTPINPGNSGGPIVDLDGKIIGINTAIASAPGGGLGFSIPIDLALRIAHQLEAGAVTVGWLGVRMSDNNPSLDEVWGRSIGQGALIQEVYEGSPASRAELKPDDVVVSFAGRRIRSEFDLRSVTKIAPTDEPLEISVWRTERGDDVLNTYTVVLESRPIDSRQAPPEIQGENGTNADVAYLAREIGLHVESQRNKVVVLKVEPGSLASDAELKAGDVLIEIDSQAVAGVRTFRESLQGGTKRFLSVVVERDGERIFLGIERP